jgi:hypothetical protein
MNQMIEGTLQTQNKTRMATTMWLALSIGGFQGQGYDNMLDKTKYF